MLNQLCAPWINLILLWCIVLFMYSIWLSNTWLRIFTSMIMRDIGLFFPVMSLPRFHVMTVLVNAFAFTFPFMHWRRKWHPLQWHPTQIPWTEEPGGLWSLGSQRVGHDWSDFTFTFHFHALEKDMAPTPVFLPAESLRRGSLVGCRLWGRTELDTTEAT